MQTNHTLHVLPPVETVLSSTTADDQLKCGTHTPLPYTQSMPPGEIPPAHAPLEACAWCWPHLYPGQPYPAHWSSTICPEHDAWFDEHRIARRARRLIQQEVI
jgi:hypothetical protein